MRLFSEQPELCKHVPKVVKIMQTFPEYQQIMRICTKINENCRNMGNTLWPFMPHHVQSIELMV